MKLPKDQPTSSSTLQHSLPRNNHPFPLRSQHLLVSLFTNSLGWQLLPPPRDTERPGGHCQHGASFARDRGPVVQ